MQIKIKLEASQIVGIDIYELTDDSLEGTLQAILGSYSPTLTSIGSSTAISTSTVPSTVELDLPVESVEEDVSTSEQPSGYPNLADMTWDAWVVFMHDLGGRADSQVVTTWLDHVIFPRGRGACRIFRQARTVHDLIRQNPEITRRLSMEMWVELVQMLNTAGVLPNISISTARTYYNTGRRLTS